MRVPVRKTLSRLASDWMTIALAMSIAITATIVMPTASAVAEIREANSDEPSTSEANDPTSWETGDAECVKYGEDDGDTPLNGFQWGVDNEWVANGDYSRVVIKSAQTNGIFDGVQAGELLGSPSFNPNNNQRQGISHIIVCYDLVCEEIGGVSAPAINHAVVVFGGDGDDYVSGNHTFGNDGPAYVRGVAIDGSAKFPNYSTSFDGSSVNYITGGYTGVLPTANGGSWATTGFPYSQQTWIEYAEALADFVEQARQTDPNAYPNVNVYHFNGDSVTLTNDGDNTNSSNQKLHVVVGSGTVYPTQAQNDKTDGAIIAPQAKLNINRSNLGFIDGFVVAAQITEIGAPNANNGLQIHGRVPHALVDVPGECVPPTTLPPTTTIAPDPAGYVQLDTECGVLIEGSVVNTGNVDLTFVFTSESVSTPPQTLLVGDSHPIGPAEGTVKVELFDGNTLIDSDEVTYPGECWVPPTAADCVADATGMLQVINPVPGDGDDFVTEFVRLDPIAGNYVPASDWTTINWTEMGLDGFIMNAAAFDSDTGKAYAAVRGYVGGEAPVLIQFDDAGNVGFLGRLRWNGSGVIAGYIHDGVYYYNSNSGISSVSGLDSLPVYETYAEATDVISTDLGTSGVPHGADYAVIEASDGADWLVWYQKNADKIYGYPVNAISGQPTVMDIVRGPGVPTSQPVDGPFNAPNGLLIGAKWSHGGNVYLGDNNGSGVFVLSSIDPAAQTAALFTTAITDTTVTNRNDGFSCGAGYVPPTPPTAILNVECVIDDFYNVGAEIYGGSLGVNWRLEKSSGELITAGVVPAWTTETPALTEPAQFTEGLVLVLMSLDSDTTLDSKPVPAPCFAPVPSASLVLDPECDVDVTGSITNDGETTLYGAIYVNDVLVLSDTEIQIGQTVDFQIPASDLTAGDEIKLLAWDDNEFESAKTVVYPEPCPQPVGELAIECVVNNDYRISGSVTATDAGLAWGLGNRAPFLRLDGGRIGANVTDSFDDVYTLTPGSTVFLREQGAGPDWIEFDTVPEGCPIAPTGDISIKCFEDDLYDVAAEIDGGSVGVKWMIRIKGGGGIVTKGSVPAFATDEFDLEAKQLEQGLVLVLRAPDNGGKLDSVTVPASCFAPVSDALIALDTECDAEAKGSITNTGETTLIGNVHINDEVLPDDIEIAPGETEEFILLAELLEEGDVVKLVASGPEDYEREQALTYRKPCPTTTVVIETPTTVPATTTTVPDTTTTTPDGGGTVAETPSAEPVEQTPTFTG